MLEVKDFSALENMLVYLPARRCLGGVRGASWTVVSTCKVLELHVRCRSETDSWNCADRLRAIKQRGTLFPQAHAMENSNALAPLVIEKTAEQHTLIKGESNASKRPHASCGDLMDKGPLA